MISALVRKLGMYKSRKQGEEKIFTCPRCHRQKMEVNLHKEVFHCLRCNYSGALRALFRELSIEQSYDGKKDYRPLDFRADLRESAIAQVIPGFKQFTEESCNSMLDFLNSRGFLTSEDFQRIGFMGWGTSSDRRYRNRLMIPIYEGDVIGSWIARSTDKSEPKELSGPNRGDFLYNINEVKPGSRVIIVEGVFDCEAVRRAGHICVSSSGAHMTAVQMGKLISRKPSGVQLFYDGDDAGDKGARASMGDWLQRSSIPITTCYLPISKDPDELSAQELKELLR